MNENGRVINKIGILTSGGDAPGMNATIRAVVRAAAAKQIEIVGIKKGYNGLINGEFVDMKANSVSDIISRGGTILLTARAPELMTQEGQIKAANMAKAYRLDAIVVIGGDGSFRGANDLSKLGVNVIGIPATIDLDLGCTDYTIGFDTAVNTAMDAITKIRDTSSSHERCSVVEVMGRGAGYLALWCGMTSGAEYVVLPEVHNEANIGETVTEIVELVLDNRSKGKTHNLIVVAEGVDCTDMIVNRLKETTGIDTRATVLGHLQRGGSPSSVDRLHASMMGNMAVNLLTEGKTNRVICYKNGEYIDYDIEQALNMTKEIDLNMYNIVRTLSV